MKTNLRASCLLILFLQTIVCNSQDITKIRQEGLNGIFSSVKKDKSGKKKLIKIYLYKIVSNDSKKILGKVEKFPSKKEKGDPKEGYFTSDFQIIGNSYLLSNLILLSRHDENFYSIKIEGKNFISVSLNDSSNSEYGYIGGLKKGNILKGEYQRVESQIEEYQKFIINAYKKLLNKSSIGYYRFYLGNSVGFDELFIKNSNTRSADEVILSLLRASVVQASFFSESEKKLKKSYKFDISSLEAKIPEILNFKKRRFSPTLNYFPNINIIETQYFKISNISRRQDGVDVKIEKTYEGELKETEFVEFKKDQELSKIRQKEKSRKAKNHNINKFRKSIVNPSGIYLDIDKNANFLPSNEIGGTHIRTINKEAFFRNLYYGNFDDLEPTTTNVLLLGNSKNYFPDFHNAFLYFAWKKHGDNYYPNMTLQTFEIKRTTKHKNGFGQVIAEYNNNSSYEISIPNAFILKFEDYLNEDQFSIYGEQFDYEFKKLIISFLDKYAPNSLPFKQMMHNLYRYSNNLKAVSKKEHLLSEF